MRTERAWAILGFSREDIPDADLTDIKQRYHRLISRHHPDLVTDADPARQKFHIEKAQLINEAYATLKDVLSSETPDLAASISHDHDKRTARGNSYRNETYHPQKKSHWKAPINKKAFCQRDIYIDGGEYKGHKLDRYKVARGKYFWNPDLEEFDMFLYSINQVAGKLLDQVEEDEFACDDFDFENAAFYGNDPDYGNSSFDRRDSGYGNSSFCGSDSVHRNTSFYGSDSGYGNNSTYRKNTLSQRSQYQVLIFHLLSEIFIDPVYCVRKIAQPISSGHEIYHFTAQMTYDQTLPPTGPLHLRPGDLLFPAFLKSNRLYVKEKVGSPLGYLSFPDDRLYLLLIPLMREKKVKLKMQATSVEKSYIQNDSHIQISLWLYLKPDENQKPRQTSSSSGQQKQAQTPSSARQQTQAQTSSPARQQTQAQKSTAHQDSENGEKRHFKSSEEYYDDLNQRLKRRLMEYASYIK